jgi:hypothetical protein
MLDFRPRAHPRGVVSHRARRRISLWILGVGLLVLFCLRFREISQFMSAGSAAAPHEVDTRFQPESGGSAAADTVRIVDSEPAPSMSEEKSPFMGVDPGLLARVRDDTPWIRSDELDAWWNIWSALKRSNVGELERASAGKIGFVELFSQPKAFRGKPVTIRGSARQVTYLAAGENSEEVQGYYRLVIWPEYGPAEPIFLYALALPSGFPIGENTQAEIEAHGLFFKRMVYPTQQEELRRAPVVMARTVDWRDSAAAETPESSDHFRFLVGLTIAGAVLLALLFWWTSRPIVLPFAQHVSEPETGQQDAAKIGAAMRQLAEKEQ